MQNESKPRNRYGIFMDEAVSKTSKLFLEIKMINFEYIVKIIY